MIIKKCQSGGAYIVRMEEKIDLERISNKYEVIAKTPVLIIIKDKYKVTVYRNGKLMIECNSEEEAELQAKSLLKTC